MSDIQAGQAIEAAVDPAAEAVSTENTAADTTAAETDAVEGGEEAPDGEGEKARDEFPKKAVNALNRAKRNNRVLTAKLRQQDAVIAELMSRVTQREPEPDINKFEAYPDYLKAQLKHELKQEMTESSRTEQVKAATAERDNTIAQRNAELASQTAEVAKAIPDYVATVSTNAAVFDSLPEDVAQLVYELDNPPVAIYALAKEGRLADLVHMSPALAAATLLQAEQRGTAYLTSTKRTTTAPDPMRGAKGTGVANKQLHEKSPDELMKWLKS